MKETNTETKAVRKQPSPLDWRVTVRRLPASSTATPRGCSDCGCGAPLRQPQAFVGTQD